MGREGTLSEGPFSPQTSLILRTFLCRGAFTVHIRLCCAMRSRVPSMSQRNAPGRGKFLLDGEAGKQKEIGYRTCFVGDRLYCLDIRYIHKFRKASSLFLKFKRFYNCGKRNDTRVVPYKPFRSKNKPAIAHQTRAIADLFIKFSPLHHTKTFLSLISF